VRTQTGLNALLRDQFTVDVRPDCGHQSGLGCRGRGQSGECRHCRVGPIRALRWTDRSPGRNPRATAPITSDG